MRFHVTSFRAGDRVFDDTARREISAVLRDIRIEDVEALHAGSGRTGVQSTMNALIRERLTDAPFHWQPEVAVFEKDDGAQKGVWTMDFVKELADGKNRVGLEVTFNHAEALAWTTIRLALAHEAETVLPNARIMAGAIIIPTDEFKKGKIAASGKGRVDSAVGTYERLRTMLPKLRYYVHLPLLIYGLEWSDGGQIGEIDEMDIHLTSSGLAPK